MKRTVLQYKKGDRPTKFMLLEYIRDSADGARFFCGEIYKELLSFKVMFIIQATIQFIICVALLTVLITLNK